ncbi:glycoside hydrolase family 43 protein [Salibacterium halotolerans]|uniref:Alpha-N-arabinofuranosidase n=1 Tax=Salibacterium halotolerans TaxID=1884432 RepID=A0A1I5S4X3_9BACI|nr:glycoside hydrolase family 43 protein [Salibacterium halotolerans]SFP65316.1 alpha-N-arabinofuranosidase [Salibacterium halotolerans]
MNTFKNPVLQGFYPDPSICRVGEDYYMVTSTFEYFPGVPIFHSKDLVNWKQIGHVLDRPSQLDLEGTPPSRGIYAPTIRYHDGVFYMITTFVVSREGERQNFYVTAEDPAGPWSDPNWLKGAPGIDPSLFFDTDGRVYYTGNRKPPRGREYAKHNEIWMQELDLKTKQLTGEVYSLWEGALKTAHAQEAPHLYFENGWYYLMIAEGGTGFTHAVTMARSRNITGPYEGCRRNPILTHRHLGRLADITNVGHADIVKTQNGEWWMVCLASRPYGGEYRNLGRETFLVPFTWEDEWPLVHPGKGVIEREMKRPDLPDTPWETMEACDHFDMDTLRDVWNFIRTPHDSFWSLNDRPGYLRLRTKKEAVTEVANPSFAGRRQQHLSMTVQAAMEFQPAQPGETAGLLLLQNHNYQFRLEYGEFPDGRGIRVVKRTDGEEQVLGRMACDGKRLVLKVTARGQSYSFFAGDGEDSMDPVAEDADGRILSTDMAGGFTGAYIGMFTSSNGRESSNHADFDWFCYEGQD